MISDHLARKLSPGVHTVRIKTGKGSKTRLQKVRVNAKGQWKFMKNTGSKPKKRRVSTPRSTSRARRSNPRKKVSTTAKSKMLRTMSLEGGVEDIAWGFIGFTVLGKNATALPMTRTIQGLAAHALDRRGKARLVPAILDLVTLWLAGGFGKNGSRIGTSSVVRQLQKVSFL